MALTTQIWEDSGPLTGSPLAPTTRHEVSNIGFKNSGLDETFPFIDYPIGRPYLGGSPTPYVCSYTKYNYFKIFGTYSKVINLSVSFAPASIWTPTSNVAKNIRIYYKWTNVYEEPTNVLMTGGTYFDPYISSPPSLGIPNLSTTDPRDATLQIPVLTNNQTYYTAYLVLQLYVEADPLNSYTNYGNLKSDFALNINYTERKTGLPGYAPDNVNWSW